MIVTRTDAFGLRYLFNVNTSWQVKTSRLPVQALGYLGAEGIEARKAWAASLRNLVPSPPHWRKYWLVYSIEYFRSCTVISIVLYCIVLIRTFVCALLCYTTVHYVRRTSTYDTSFGITVAVARCQEPVSPSQSCIWNLNHLTAHVAVSGKSIQMLLYRTGRRVAVSILHFDIATNNISHKNPQQCLQSHRSTHFVGTLARSGSPQ